MMIIAHLKDVYQHMEWADATVWNAVCASDSASESTYIMDMLFHIHETQHAFLDVWNGLPLVRKNRAEVDSIAKHKAWAKEFHATVPGFVHSLTETKLREVCVLSWAHYFTRSLGHEPHETTLVETMHQLVSHSMHHRAQVVRAIRELGETPPGTDYILWLWSGRPEAHWI